MGIDKIGTRKVVQREKYGEKSEAQKNDARNVRCKKSEARKVGHEKWCDINGARNVRCETSGAQSGE